MQWQCCTLVAVCNASSQSETNCSLLMLYRGYDHESRGTALAMSSTNRNYRSIFSSERVSIIIIKHNGLYKSWNPSESKIQSLSEMVASYQNRTLTLDFVFLYRAHILRHLSFRYWAYLSLPFMKVVRYSHLPVRSLLSRKKRRNGNQCLKLHWARLTLGDMKTGTRSSRLGAGYKALQKISIVQRK
jgi:hypothetical protein